MIKIPSGNHSTKQQHDLVEKSESTSILFCSSWRSSQNPHVPFELEWFQFFPLSARSRVCQTERFFPRCGRKKALSDFVTFSLSLSPSCFCFCITCVFCFCVWSQFSFMYCFVNIFLFI